MFSRLLIFVPAFDQLSQHELVKNPYDSFKKIRGMLMRTQPLDENLFVYKGDTLTSSVGM